MTSGGRVFVNGVQGLKEIVSTVVMGLCLIFLMGSHAQAKTLTLTYDIQATFDDEFARSLFYFKSPDDPDPYSRPRACRHGETCYPEDWAPGLLSHRGVRLGDQISAQIEVIANERDDGTYHVQSIHQTTALQDGTALSLFHWAAGTWMLNLDSATGDVRFLAYDNFSSGWDISLAGGTGILNFQTEYGTPTGDLSRCFAPYNTSHAAALGLPDPFCEAYDAEAVFVVDSYDMTILVSTPVPMSALLLASAIGGLFMRARRKTSQIGTC